MIISILFKRDCIWKLKIKIFRNFSPLSENPKPRSPLSFYPADQKILAYQRHLYIRRHVKYPGSANIPRNARNVLRVPEPSLSLSSNPFPPLVTHSAAVFPRWTISHVPSSVPAPERFTALALYVCLCVFIAGHFYAFIPARARVLDQSSPPITDVKKENRNASNENEGNLQLVTFASSMYLSTSPSHPLLSHLNIGLIVWWIKTDTD